MAGLLMLAAYACCSLRENEFQVRSTRTLWHPRTVGLKVHTMLPFVEKIFIQTAEIVRAFIEAIGEHVHLPMTKGVSNRKIGSILSPTIAIQPKSSDLDPVASGTAGTERGAGLSYTSVPQRPQFWGADLLLAMMLG